MPLNRRQAREQAFIILFEYAFRGNIDEILEDFWERHRELVSANAAPAKLSQEGEARLDESYRSPCPNENYIRQICERFISGMENIDETIGKHSKNWKKDRISNVSLAVLRLGVCEMLYFDDIPMLVSISEALEIVKKYEGEEAIPFVNGILEGVRAEGDT